MATILRVQNSNGDGPYRSFCDCPELKDMLDRHNLTEEEHPTPPDDGFYGSRNDSFYHGFADMDQLQSWFTDGELDILDKNGYEVVTLHDVDMVETLDHQVIFRR